MKQRTTVVGVFNDRKAANDAVDALKRAGFRDDQIGVAGRYDEAVGTRTEAAAEGESMWEEGAATGVLAGAGLGALVGLGILAGMIPAIGPVIAGGTLAVLAANAAGGAAIAGLAGALIGAGIPEEEAHYYENEFRSGRTIVTVKADGRAVEANEILRRFGAYDMHTAGGSTTTAATHASAAATHASAAAAGQACATPVAGAHTARAGESIQLHEEQLHATKAPVETGEVRVRKEVVSEHKTIDVPVQREEVVIERHPVSGTASSADIREGEEIRIPVKEEQVRVEKQAVVKEEVNVGKRVVTDTERVGGEVRKEQVKVERTGDVDVHASQDVKTPRNRP